MVYVRNMKNMLSKLRRDGEKMVKYVPKGKCLSFSEEWLTVRTIKLLFIFNDVFLFGGFNNFKIYCTYFLNKLTFAIDINLLAVSLFILIIQLCGIIKTLFHF